MAVVDLLLFFFFFFSSATTFNLNSCLGWAPPGQICDAGARSGNRNSNWRRQPVGGAGRDGGPHPAQLEGKTRSALGKECVESLMEGWPVLLPSGEAAGGGSLPSPTTLAPSSRPT